MSNYQKRTKRAWEENEHDESRQPNIGYVFFIDEVRELIRRYNNKEIMISKLTEVLNEKATGRSSMEIIKMSPQDKCFTKEMLADDLGCHVTDRELEYFNRKVELYIENKHK